MAYIPPFAKTFATGLTDIFTVPFEYISRKHVEVIQDGVLLEDGEDYIWLDASNIQLTEMPPNGSEIVRQRVTPIDDMLVEQQPSFYNHNDANTASEQLLFLAQETAEDVNDLEQDLSGLEDLIDRLRDLINAIGADENPLPKNPVIIYRGQSNTAANERADSGDKTPDSRVKVYNPLSDEVEIFNPGVYPCREATPPNTAPNPMALTLGKLYAELTGSTSVTFIFVWKPATPIETWTYLAAGGSNNFQNNWDKLTTETSTVKNVTAVSRVNPIQLQIADHGYAKGDLVAPLGMPADYEVNGNRYLIDVVDEDWIALRGVDGTGFTPYPGTGGTVAEAKFKGERVVEMALAKLGRTSVDFVLGAQGESDATFGSKYFFDMKVKQIEADRAKSWCRSDTRHIDLEMSRRANYGDVNAALNTLYRSNRFPTFSLVPTLGITMTADEDPRLGDTTHYAGVGQVEIAGRFMATMISPKVYLGESSDRGVVFVKGGGTKAAPEQIDASINGQVIANTLSGINYINLDPRDAYRGNLVHLHNFSGTGVMWVTCDANITKTVAITGRTADDPGLLHFEPLLTTPLRDNQTLLFFGTTLSGLDGNAYVSDEIDFDAGHFALRLNPVTLIDGTAWGTLAGGATATILPRTTQDPRTGRTDVDHFCVMPGEAVTMVSLGANEDTRNLRVQSARLNPQHSWDINRFYPDNALWNGDFAAMDSGWKLNQWAQAQITEGFLVGDVGTGYLPLQRSIYHTGPTLRDAADVTPDALDFYHIDGIPCRAGEVAQFTIWYKTENSALLSQCRGFIDYYDKDGVLISSDTLVSDATSYTSWTRRDLTSITVAPANTYTARPKMRVTKSAGTIRFAHCTAVNLAKEKPLEAILIDVGDETTAITAGTAKKTFRMPYAFNLSSIKASLAAAQPSGLIFTVDVNEAGVSILSTKITIDNTEKTSVTAAVAPVLSNLALAADAEITIDVDQVGASGAAGLKVTLIGRRV